MILDYNSPGLLRHDAPDTSVAAAYSTLTGPARLRVFEAIQAADSNGMTDEEGYAATGMSPNTYRPRRKELEAAGYVKKTDMRRIGASGSKAAVWVAL